MTKTSLLFEPAMPWISLKNGAVASRPLDALEQAVALVRSGECGALVTGPVAKSAIAEIDPTFVGQTEFLADACGLPREDAVMMLAGPSLKTVPMTVHCALADVPARLSQDLIVQRSRIVHKALRSDYGIENPRIAIAGLNPHAGEGGLFGTDDEKIVAPAIAEAQQIGVDAYGPFGADTMYLDESYDAYVVMFHDQGHIPAKLLGFNGTAAFAIGTPVLFSSVAHGSALDIAGRGKADPGALIWAIKQVSGAAVSAED